MEMEIVVLIKSMFVIGYVVYVYMWLKIEYMINCNEKFLLILEEIINEFFI